ncbi:MAG: BatA domain-containing protein [Pirellulales bacterium]
MTPLLLGGAALVAVPIVLHLIMRREAQQLKFPALRFVQQRRTLNQHRLRLRQLLLLALRCAIIALLAFALARPTLRSSSAAGKEGAPVATALVFDNSLRMQYEHENRSRLEQAKELATWLLEQIPADSPVTIVDRGGRQRGQDLDHEAAELRVERLDLSATARPMQDALRDAMSWLDDKPDHRGEIYVFTDMTSEAWAADTIAEFRKSLEESPGTNVYLIDVGAPEPRNLGLGGLRLSSERLAPGGLLRLETELSAIGEANDGEEAVVELYVGDGAEGPEKRGQQVVALSNERSTPVEFSLSGLGLGTHQGFVRLAASDALPADDVRYFTVEVRPPSKILLLAESTDDTLFLGEALAPTAAAGLVQPRFACDVSEYSRLEELPLAEYGAICLVDPPLLPDPAWKALVDFADKGGGVGVFLGRHARREEMNRPEPQQLLPAKLRWQSREATYLRPVAVEHPALSELSELGDAVPWSEFPVFKYWELEAGSESAHVVASFANGKPALLERQIGAGRVLMLTTPISDPAHGDPWNLLPTGSDPWPFLALANGITQYLTGAWEAQLNYFAGQTVVLPLAPEEQVTNYVLQMPDGSAVRQPLTPGQQDLSVAATEALGNYRVRAGGRQERLDRGFSVNLPAELTRLDRTSGLEILKALGEERARLARTRDEIEVRVGLARTGRELFPIVILVVALVLAAEQWLANRFYEGAASRAEYSRGGVKERGRQGESGSRMNLPVSPSPPLPV